MANTNFLKGIRCPMCFETNGFVVQMTMNVIVQDDGFDFMGGQFADDHFPGRVIDDEDGFNDDDPISCANRNGCGHTGTVDEFRESTQNGTNTPTHEYEGAQR